MFRMSAFLICGTRSVVGPSKHYYAHWNFMAMNFARLNVHANEI